MELEKYIYSECQNPIKLKVYNGITNTYDVKELPCGKCYHCKITRINEWVTRMVVQSNYSKYVYFGTLTYNGNKVTTLNDECLSLISSFNERKHPNDTPIILRKDHVQNFFKRLRKNTGIKLQYAYCGEYGSTYSRPHYHYIIWSNDPISILSIYKAWSAPRKDGKGKTPIGKVEHRDIKNNPDPRYNDPDGTWAYKYVCKYIQKFDFKFEELKTLKLHKLTYEKNFKPIHSITTQEDYYLTTRVDNYLKEKNIKSWKEYRKAFSPFFSCSKKPAIGYQYLADNLKSFQNGDLRLFGLSKEYIFPLYFIRKTKESLCPLKAQSQTNSNLTSFSRLPKMAALIDNIQTAESIAEDTNQIVQLFSYNGNYYSLESRKQLQDLDQLYDNNDRQPNRVTHYLFKREYLGFTNIETHVEYTFYGDFFVMRNSTTGKYIGTESLENVKNLITYYYERLKRKILLPLYGKSKISADKKAALIEEYGGEEKFKLDKEQCVKQFMVNINQKQRLYKQTKTFD